MKKGVWSPQPGPQTEAIAATWCKEMLFGGAKYGGKKLSVDAELITPFGTVRNGDVRIGQQLCNPDGTICRVLLAHPISEVELYKVRTVDGRSVLACADHLWYAWGTDRRYKAKRKYLHGDDKIKGRVYTTEQLNTLLTDTSIHLQIPLTQPVTFTKSYRSEQRPVDPYLLGVLLGDGSLTSQRARFTSNDPEIADSIRQMGYEVALYENDYRIQGKGGAQLKQELKRIGVWGKLAHQKHIPKPYLLNSVEGRFEILRGLMDTDGYADDRGHASFCSTSKQLADDVCWLARSLGAIASITEKDPFYKKDGKKIAGRKAFNVWIRHPDNKRLFKLRRKQKRCRTEREYGLRIKSVTPAGKGFARCITVDHPNGLYLTNDFIVTHNSDYLLGDFLQDVPRYNKNWHGIIFRQSVPELEEIIQRSHELFPMTGADWGEAKHTWTFREGSTLKLRPLENVRDAGKYWGHSYPWIAFDEATRWSDFLKCYRLAGLANNRWGRAPVPTKRLRVTANPGGPGHEQVKRYFGLAKDKWPRGFQPFRDAATGNIKMFIPSRITDNILGLRADPNYINNLQGLGSPQMVQAWLEGNWDIVVGAFFAEFTKRHIISPFNIPKHWVKFRSMDYGSSAPFSIGWWAVADGSNQYPEGALIRYREWYGSNGKGEGLRLTAKEIAEGIKERSGDEVYAYNVGDSSIWDEDNGPSIGEDFATSGIYFKKADKRREQGWNQFRFRLKGKPVGAGERPIPLVYVFDTCLSSIELIPAATQDPHNLEDVNTHCEDHVLDEWRYAFMSRPWFVQPKTEEEIRAEKRKVDHNKMMEQLEELRQIV